MPERDIIEGQVIGSNLINSGGRIIACWTNGMQDAVAPQPLDLEEHIGKTVQVSGRLRGDLYEAKYEQKVFEEGFQEITSKVIGSNIIEGPDGKSIRCYRHGMVEAWYGPLYLYEYVGMTITVAGYLHGDLYKASIVKVHRPGADKDPAKEAKSLNDLLRIRADNRDKIEAINQNLGSALGFKWTNGQKTDHPCVIIFVPQKMLPWLVPDDQKTPEFLEGADGTWCYTDVVTGKKAESLEEIVMPELSADNKQVIRELRSGRVGLTGGIQLAFFGDGIRRQDHAFVGTAGIAVRHPISHRIGFLTNQHVADARGRRIYHPWHNYYPIGTTYSTFEHEADEDWYGGVIDEARSYVRCDCGFVPVDEHLEAYVEAGLHRIGDTGSLLRIDADTMDIIGQKVISVGRTRGVQRGTVVAYSYEFQDDYFSIYTDLLIIGEDGNAFSAKGDSGKIIVTDDADHRPVALLWGGWQERLRQGREQENWTYAIDLGKVMDRLDVELLG